MKANIVKWIITWALQYLTKEVVEELVQKYKPMLRDALNETINDLRAKAKLTDNTIDDAGVDALGWAVDEFLGTGNSV